MSVDIEEMAAHLERQRLKDVKEQYDTRATNATVAFLLCFFLGYLGAHRFYLGQWRSGLAHLVVFTLGAASVITGFLTTAPLNAALFVIGGVLVLASLIWEIIDLGRIDGEIHHRNTLLAEGLIAGALLADPTAIEGVARKVDETVHTAAAQSRAAGAIHAGSATAGMISLEDLAQARALAEESGRASISYQELSNFTVSATPEEQSGAEPVFKPATVTERHVNTEPLPASPEAAPVVEAQTHTHSENGYRVSDTEETDRVSGPSAAEVVGLGAAALGAAGLGFGMAEATHPQGVPASEPALQATSEPAVAPSLSLLPSRRRSTSRPPRSQRLHRPKTLPRRWNRPPTSRPLSQSLPLSQRRTAEPVAFAPPETPAEPVAPRIGSDVTDAGAPDYIEPAADVAFASSYPGYITLPDEPTPAPSEPIFASEGYTEPLAGTSAADAVTEPDIPLYFSPEATAPTYTPPATPEPPAESYVPPVPDVYSASAPQPETYTPSWEAPAAPVSPAPEPVAPAQEPQPLAELAGLGVVAGAGALAADTRSPTTAATARRRARRR